MKARKSKLIALGLAALMAVSPLSSMAYAEELLLDDGELIEEFVEEEADAPAEEEAAEAPENVEAPAAEETTGDGDLDADYVGDLVSEEPEDVGENAYTIDETTITFHYGETAPAPGFNQIYPDYTVTYYKVSTATGQREQNVSVHDKLAVEYKRSEADCENPAYIILTINIDGKTYYSTDEFNKPATAENAFVVKGSTPLKHHYVKMGEGYRDYDSDCHATIYDLYVCDRDGCTNEKFPAEWVDSLDEIHNTAKNFPTGHERRVRTWTDAEQALHSWGDSTTVYVVEVDSPALPSEVTANLTPEDQAKLQTVANTKLDGGKPVLDDVRQGGIYAEVTYQVCKRNPAHVNTTVTVKTIDAEIQKIVEAKVIEVDAKTVANPEVLNGKILYTSVDGHKADFPSLDEVRLVKCNVPGTYVVGYFGTNEAGTDIADQPSAKNTFTIAAPHHYKPYVTVEFESYDDARICDVTYNYVADPDFGAKGRPVSVKSVVNNSCWKDVTYYVVTHCSNTTGCDATACYSHGVTYFDEDGVAIKKMVPDKHLHELSREEKEAEPSGDHIINTKEENKIKKMTKPLSFSDYTAILEDAKNPKNFIKVTDNTACEQGGTITVEFPCMDCKEIQHDHTLTLEVAPYPHLWPAVPQIEYVKDPTCESQGVFNRVWVCQRPGCNAVKKEENVKAPRLAHKNELSVITDKYGNDLGIDDKENVNKLPELFRFVGDTVVDFNGQLQVGDKASVGGKYALGTTKVKVKYHNGSTAGEVKDLTVKRVGITAGSLTTQATEDYFVYGQVYTECSTCVTAPHQVILDRNVDLEVVALTPSTSDGKAGSITLKATYSYNEGGTAKTGTSTGTFNYYTSVNAYQGRVVDEPVVAGDPILEAYNVGVAVGGTVDVINAVYTNSDGEVTFTVEDESIATIENDVITGKAIGETTVTVKVAATDRFNAAEETFTVFVTPAKTYIWQLKDEGEGTLLVRWSTSNGIDEQVDGYRFAYATKEDFSDAKYSAVKAGVNHGRRYNLAPATYYVKVQTYVLDDPAAGDVHSNRIYSGWSGIKSIPVVRRLNAPAKATVSASKKGSAVIDVVPTTAAEGYQVEFKAADGTTKTTSGFTTNFIRNVGKGTFTVRVRAFKEAEDGRYFSAWINAGTVTL